MNTSILKAVENEVVSAIPPVITNNPREKIEPEQVPVNDILKYQKYRSKESTEALTSTTPSKSKIPIPLYPLSIIWSPSAMFFELDNNVILQKIRIWNACPRSIYIICCGLWGDTARLGAKWRCFPRTRYLLASGLTADLFVQATPREQSPIPSAQVAIQLAASHKRDPVTGYFVIPIIVKFKKYIKPYLGEVEDSNNNIST
ncbi:uncharacterized protein [Epargyreus clarus]|uniref:uncharacterized protein n=1 Tax=Epargyreus clarus TaxID=520877 RepID=UPI003C302644